MRQAAEAQAAGQGLAWKAAVGILIGVAGGTFGGLAGLGGGVLMVPMMTAFLGLTQHEAHGSSMLAVLFTAVSGGLGYARHGGVDWVAAVAVAFSAVVMAGYGARLSHRVPARRLRRYFGYFLVAMALIVVVSRYLMTHAAGGALPATPVVALGGILTGLVSGFLAGMMGVGGGAIVVPALVVGLGLPQHVAQGTSLVQMIPTAISGTFTHHRLGHTRWDVAPWVGAGAIAGGWLGAFVAALLPTDTLRWVFAAFIFLMGLNYVRTSAPVRPGHPSGTGGA
ncbi:MAG: sulfite exporter TauE/SafE family protein [Limnochordaceae bacterium]|nr:sulfite exporter TauE/SafE family protein [Limnochordaceae bacterium]